MAMMMKEKNIPAKRTEDKHIHGIDVMNTSKHK